MPTIFSKFTDVQCDVVGHTWDKSCSTSSIDILFKCMKYALSVYTPLYTVSILLYGTTVLILFKYNFTIHIEIFFSNCWTFNKQCCKFSLAAFCC